MRRAALFTVCLALIPAAYGTAAGGLGNQPAQADTVLNAADGTLKWMKGVNLSAFLEQDPAFQARLRGEQWASASVYFLNALGSRLRLVDAEQELAEKSVERDDLGMRHVRLQQRYHGLPVWDTAIIVHWNSQGAVYLVEGDYMPTPAGLSLAPKLDVAAALRRAESATSRPCPDCPPELGIWRGGGAGARLAYRVRIPQGLAQMWTLVIDADSGAILERLLAPR